LSKLGEYWSVFPSHQSCYLSKNKKHPKWVVAANVPLNGINWYETMTANMGTFAAEQEVTLYKHAEVEVLYILDNNGKKHKPKQKIGII